jgi:hypothetical protein
MTKIPTSTTRLSENENQQEEFFEKKPFPWLVVRAARA